MLQTTTLALLLCGLAQDPEVSHEEAMQRFTALDDDAQTEIVDTLARQIVLDGNPRVQDIVSLGKGYENYPEAEPLAFHDPSDFAKGARRRKLVKVGSGKHDKIRERYAPRPLLPELHKAVWYDWGTGVVVRRAEPLTPIEAYENLLRGFPPGSDIALAHAQEEFDRDPLQRSMAAYLAHQYADLDARVYENVTLYDAWCSGQALDIPDVDAIAFAVKILDTNEYRSPLPAGSKREALYRKIRDYTFEHRKYRRLREAAAAAFVSVEPTVDPTHASVLPRLHFMIATQDGHLPDVGTWLGSIAERKEFVKKVDRELENSWDGEGMRDVYRDQLAYMAAQVRWMAINALPD